MCTMARAVFVLGVLVLCQIRASHGQGGCPTRQELQVILRQVHKLLTTHETSYTQSLRSLRKKLNLLKNSTVRQSAKDHSHNGTDLRQNHSMDSLTSTLSPVRSLALNSGNVRPSRCTHVEGSTHCTCDAGFALTGLENSLCMDIDECELFRITQTGRLCLHNCVNSPGSYHCICPPGYNLATDSHSCQDINECESRKHNCTPDQVCVNTFGDYRCVQVECPKYPNATYIKTAQQRCERNPCMVWDKACLQAPISVSFHYMSVVSNMSTPRVLFRVSAARMLGDTLRFSLLGSQGRRHFSVVRSGQQTGQLLLVNPVLGPATLEADVEMSELERHNLLGRYVTKVTVFLSPYSF
ncbi:fibulin-7-like isoform X2 [Denticeps clupeoides]|uniref:fibulin-7-like isoform X2 n=1 Tax=Denticeps clupeoides TaxID=299321 RepID=UPI0010A3D4ED|nr:fibulin-7-like isoform X2 [Denticeps clupeoides]